MGDKDALLSIPKFDGDYEHWAMLMENLLRSKVWWDLIETGVSQPERNVILTGPQRTELAEMKLKDLKVKNYLFASIDKTILKTIAKKETAKDIWESMTTKYQGNKRVQSAQLQRLRRVFKVLEMKEGDSITSYFSRVMVVANDMRNLGEDMPDAKVVEKILRTFVKKFTYVVCAIEESNDIKEMSVDELQSSLLVHEQNLSKHAGEEHALKMEHERGRDGYSQIRGRGGYRGGRGRGYSSINKDNVECYKCHKMGHFKNECPSWEKTANYTELDEDVLLMAQMNHAKKEEENVWYLDSGCSNHMCGNKDWFLDLDSNFRKQVKLGDGRRMQVEGKGSLRLRINGINQVISSTYYVPSLENNLLSVGQLQQKGLRFIFDDDMCEVWHKQQKRVIMKSRMATNRMFAITAKVLGAKERKEDDKFIVYFSDEEEERKDPGGIREETHENSDDQAERGEEERDDPGGIREETQEMNDEAERGEEERNHPGEIREETQENNEAERGEEEDHAIGAGGSQTQRNTPEPTMVSRRRTGRTVSKPVWMKDYECKLIQEEEEEELMAMLVEEGDPVSFKCVESVDIRSGGRRW